MLIPGFEGRLKASVLADLGEARVDNEKGGPGRRTGVGR
jgi:hypothetical protein